MMALPELHISAVPPNVPRTKLRSFLRQPEGPRKKKPRARRVPQIRGLLSYLAASHPPELAPCPCRDRLPGFSGPFPSTTLNKMGPRAHLIQLCRRVYHRARQFLARPRDFSAACGMTDSALGTARGFDSFLSVRHVHDLNLNLEI